VGEGQRLIWVPIWVPGADLGARFGCRCSLIWVPVFTYLTTDLGAGVHLFGADSYLTNADLGAGVHLFGADLGAGVHLFD
jgi:hypothetical protein